MKQTKRILAVAIALLLLFSTSNIVFAADPPSAPTISLAVDTGLAGDNVTGNGTMNVGNLEVGATWEYSINSGVNWIGGTGTTFVLPDGTYPAGMIQARQAVDGVYSDNVSNPSTIVVAQNQIYNGDFQSGYTGFTTDYWYDGGDCYTEGTYAVAITSTSTHSSFAFAYDHTYGNTSGRMFVANGSYDITNVVWQSNSAMTVQSGQEYRFEAYLASFSGINTSAADGNGYPKLKFQIGDGTNWVDLGTSNVDWGTATLGAWFAIYADGTFSNEGTYYIRLINQQPDNYNDFGVDDIYFGLRGAAPSASDPGTNPTSTPETFDTSTLLSLELASDTGYSNTDKITYNGVVNVLGLQPPNYWQYSVDGGGWVTGSDSLFTVTGDGAHSVVVRQMDYTETWSEPSAPLSFTLDAIPPTVTIDSTESSPTNADPIPIVLTFSQDVYGLSLDDITITNGTKSNLLGSGSSYTLDVTPTDEGTVTVTIGQETFQDIAGNNNQADTSLIMIYDSTPPSDGSVTINSGDGYTNSTSVTLTLSSTGATQMMISENSDFSGASFESYATSKSVTLSSTNGTKTIYVKYADAAGNETTTVSDTITLDTQKPTTTITSTESSPTNTSPIPITITFNESVTGFELSSIAVSNGMATNFSGSGTTYTADIVPFGDLTVTVDVYSDVAQDVAGNGNAVATEFIVVYDTAAPTAGSIAINSGDTYTNNTSVTLTLSATGASEMMISEDADFTGASYETYATSKSFTLSSGDGTKTIYVKYKDLAGNETTETISDSITLDTAAPTSGSVSINSGASITNNTSVTLTLSATGASEMMISESSTFEGGSYESYATSKSFTLSSGDGTKTIYVKYKDLAGNETTETISDSITLDTAAPTSGSVSINSGDTYTNNTSVTLTLSATGANEMMISEDADFTGASYETYATSKSFTLSSGDGTKTIYVKYKDLAGNETTETISDSITLDTAAPTGGSVSINSGATITNNTSVTLTLSATGASEMMISEDADFTGASYETYATSKSFTLSSGDGTKIIYVKYKDLAGNETTETISDSIILDTTDPTVTISSTESIITNADPIPITITFNESVTGFELSDLTVGNGTADNFSGSGTTYTVDITPTMDGAVTVDIALNVAIDTAGNGNEAATQFSIVSDRTLPTGGTISINDGETETNDKDVTLRFFVVGATHMMISENADFSGASYEIFVPLISKSYALSDGDGTKTIYVKYKDAAGNETTETISASILLDTTPPTNGSVTINNGASFTDSRYATLKLNATGATEMIISDRSDFSGASYEAYATSKSFTLSSGDGTKIIYVKYKDALGNETDTISDRIVLDTYVAPDEPQYGTVFGYITDENGNPIPNVLVELHSDPMQTYTNADGYFEFTDVPAGEHMIYILDDRFETASGLTVAISSTVDGVCTEDTCGGDELDDGLKVEVGESQELTISFVAQADMTTSDDDSTDDTADTINVEDDDDESAGFPTWAFWLIGFGVVGAVLFFLFGKRRKDDDEDEEE